uniref:Uncharacterized protein n=1 Tax=Thermofilum pendens TaxID=2269 RepID=A0A7J3X4U5_THEPE
MSSNTHLCMWEGCGNASEVILDLQGRQLVLCREHFSQLVRRMARVAEARGRVSLSSLKIEKAKGGKVRLLIRRKRLKRG